MYSYPSKSLLIEGWRGVNHSIALINQHQIVNLLKISGLNLYHRDLPFAFNHWRRTVEGSGLDLVDCQAIDSVPLLLPNTKVDCVYRISSPIPAGDAADRRRTVTFMITELGLGSGSFAEGTETSEFFTRDDNSIVTASEWSRQRILDRGYAPEKVGVIPLGVDSGVFTPLNASERSMIRLQMGFHPDETVFVNVGAALWNKGIDVLLRAFAALRARGRRVRLVLKDQRDVYGISVEQTIATVGASCPDLLRAENLAAIHVIPNKLDRSQLRTLYGIADAYVSPYRAEGFNLPPLEAIACGTPLIVTRGGATDDFCNDDVAYRIDGRPFAIQDPAGGATGYYIEPDLDALVTAMDRLADGYGLHTARYAAARADVLTKFTWANAAAKLAAMTVGIEAAPAGRPIIASVVQLPVRQTEVLSVLRMVRPNVLAPGSKVRVGNAYDGGYVVPNHALRCEAVLSIGVGNDVSFDSALADRGALVLQFDHTVDGPPSEHANFRFHKLGWGRETKGDLLSFADMLDTFGKMPAQRSMLKFDVEGAEYEALETLTEDDLMRFEVIVCELHDFARLGERPMLDRIRSTLDKLTRHHAPVHLHANNYRSVTLIAGVPVPDVLELTLLRRDLEQLDELSSEPIPGFLDRPNNPSTSDICLSVF